MRSISSLILLAICSLSFADATIKCRLKNEFCENNEAIERVSFCRWKILHQEELEHEDATTLRYKKAIGSVNNEDGSDAKEIIQVTEVNRYTGDAIVTKRFYKDGNDIGPYAPFLLDVPLPPAYMKCESVTKKF